MSDKPTNNQTTYFPEYRIYKPNTAKTGAASKLQLKVKQESYREVFLFWESAQQTGIDANNNASFGWTDAKKKITFKLEAIDIGEILAVLNGKKSFAGLPAKDGKGGAIFHKNASGNAVFKFQKMEKDGVTNYWFELTSKKNSGELTAVKHIITAAEGEILRTLLEGALLVMFSWK
jgi:hypothetical protein